MARSFIAGCGYVGTTLAGRLLADGDEVWGLRRTVGALPPGVRSVCADLSDPASLRQLPEEIDTVFYTAAADARDEVAYRAAYVTGLGNLLAALGGADGFKGRRLLFASSTGVYGQDAGEWVDEASATEPRSFTGAVVREGEQLALAASAHATVVRFGGIYGPGRDRMIVMVRDGRLSAAAAPHYANRIHRDDCAGVLRHLARLDDPEATYNAVDDDPADRNDVVGWLAARLARPTAAASDKAGPATGKRCRNTRLKMSGYRFAYPTFREGYGALLGG